MSWVLLQAGGGLLLLMAGGDFLVRGASSLAGRLGVSQLAIGLTVVAFGTSAPELVVSLDAGLSGATDISVGNVVGSNIANVALILGLALLVRPARVEAKVVRVDAPIMVAASLLLVGLLADGDLSRVEGTLLFGCLIGYTIYTFWEARRARKVVREEFTSAVPAAPVSALLGGVLAVGGLALLVGGGQLLVGAAIELASAIGVSEAVIGLTVVALGTSLPELATSLVAALRGQGDIAVGNVVGSNVFNILGILGVTAAIHPLAVGGITRADLGVMVLLAAALAVALFTRERLGRPEAGVLLVAYLGYTTWLLAG